MSESSSGNSSVSKSLMWMMIALFAGMGVLLGGGIFLAKRAVSSIGLTATTNKETIKTPVGSLRMEQESQVGPGLPVYPHASMQMPSEEGAEAAIKDEQAGISKVVYRTTDTREFVDEWYSKHLSPEFVRYDEGSKPASDIFRDTRIADTDVAFVAERGQKVRIIQLSLDPGGTKITLIRLNKPSPQPAP